MALTQQQIQEARQELGITNATGDAHTKRMERLRSIVQEGQKTQELSTQVGTKPLSDISSTIDEPKEERSLLGKSADVINTGVEAFTGAVKKTGVPSLIGGAIGASSAVIGGGIGAVLETGKQTIQGLVPGGKGFEAEEIPKTAMNIGKKTGSFGFNIGKEGAAGAPLAGFGKGVQVVMGAGQTYSGIENLVEGMKTGNEEQMFQGGTDLALGLLGARGVFKQKGIILDPEVKAGAKNIYNNIYKKRVSEPKFSNVNQLIKAIDDVETKTPSQVIEVIKPKKSKVETSLEASNKAFKKAKTEAPALTIKEKWAGVRPDIKKGIEGKHKLLEEYFNVVKTRNLDPRAITGRGHGGEYVMKAQKGVSKALTDVGGPIGEFRQKFSQTQAPFKTTYKGKKVQYYGVDYVAKNFDVELNKLNLAFDNRGIVIQPKNKIPLVSKAEVKVINELNAINRTVRNNPTIENIIDARIAYDNKINFSKQAKEVSNSIDSLSRQMRKSFAKINESMVGKQQAQIYRDFSLLKEAEADLMKFTKGRAGAEYLIKLLLSGRNREALELVQAIKKYTGIDLMDHAIMSHLATELLGNVDQQNLFRKEVASAALDAKKAMSGDTIGSAMLLFKKGVDYAIDVEKVFLEAAGKKPKSVFGKKKSISQ